MGMTIGVELLAVVWGPLCHVEAVIDGTFSFTLAVRTRRKGQFDPEEPAEKLLPLTTPLEANTVLEPLPIFFPFFLPLAFFCSGLDFLSVTMRRPRPR